MGDKKTVGEGVWKLMQHRLGYSDAEIEIFKNDPRNEKIMARAAELLGKTVVFEVVEAHNCNVGHKVGDKFPFSAEGYMLAHKGPKKVCPYLMPAFTRLMWLVQERIYEGLDPQPIFPRSHCDDVGIGCGGWGQVLIETKIVDRI